MTPQVKAALHEGVHNILQSMIVTVDGKISDATKRWYEHYERRFEGLITDTLQPEIERLVVEARVDENLACQKIIKSKFGTNDQLWDMEHRIIQLTKSNQEEVK